MMYLDNCLRESMAEEKDLSENSSHSGITLDVEDDDDDISVDEPQDPIFTWIVCDIPVDGRSLKRVSSITTFNVEDDIEDPSIQIDKGDNENVSSWKYQDLMIRNKLYDALDTRLQARQQRLSFVPMSVVEEQLAVIFDGFDEQNNIINPSSDDSSQEPLRDRTNSIQKPRRSSLLISPPAMDTTDCDYTATTEDEDDFTDYYDDEGTVIVPRPSKAAVSVQAILRGYLARSRHHEQNVDN